MISLISNFIYYREFIKNYSPNFFAYNGHWNLMHAMKKRCGYTEKDKIHPEETKEKCSGFTIYPKDYFYAANWNNWLFAFEGINIDAINKFHDITRDSYIIHFADPHSAGEHIRFNQFSEYEKLVKEFCPKLYSCIDDDF